MSDCRMGFVLSAWPMDRKDVTYGTKLSPAR